MKTVDRQMTVRTFAVLTPLVETHAGMFAEIMADHKMIAKASVASNR